MICILSYAQIVTRWAIRLHIFVSMERIWNRNVCRILMSRILLLQPWLIVRLVLSVSQYAYLNPWPLMGRPLCSFQLCLCLCVVFRWGCNSVMLIQIFILVYVEFCYFVLYSPRNLYLICSIECPIIAIVPCFAVCGYNDIASIQLSEFVWMRTHDQVLSCSCSYQFVVTRCTFVFHVGIFYRCTDYNSHRSVQVKINPA